MKKHNLTLIETPYKDKIKNGEYSVEFSEDKIKSISKRINGELKNIIVGNQSGNNNSSNLSNSKEFYITSYNYYTGGIFGMELTCFCFFDENDNLHFYSLVINEQDNWFGFFEGPEKNTFFRKGYKYSITAMYAEHFENTENINYNFCYRQKYLGNGEFGEKEIVSAIQEIIVVDADYDYSNYIPDLLDKMLN